jgi:hypothetical protein
MARKKKEDDMPNIEHLSLHVQDIKEVFGKVSKIENIFKVDKEDPITRQFLGINRTIIELDKADVKWKDGKSYAENSGTIEDLTASLMAQSLLFVFGRENSRRVLLFEMFLFDQNVYEDGISVGYGCGDGKYTKDKWCVKLLSEVNGIRTIAENGMGGVMAWIMEVMTTLLIFSTVNNFDVWKYLDLFVEAHEGDRDYSYEPFASYTPF